MPRAVPVGLRPLQGAAPRRPGARRAGAEQGLILGSRILLATLWLLHWLPLPLQAALGRSLGRLLHAAAGPRRAIALRNVELCFPEMDERARRGLERGHFQWLARSILQRGVLLYAATARLKRLIPGQGDPTLAQRRG